MWVTRIISGSVEDFSPPGGLGSSCGDSPDRGEFDDERPPSSSLSIISVFFSGCTGWGGLPSSIGTASSSSLSTSQSPSMSNTLAMDILSRHAFTSALRFCNSPRSLASWPTRVLLSLGNNTVAGNVVTTITRAVDREANRFPAVCKPICPKPYKVNLHTYIYAFSLAPTTSRVQRQK